MEEPTVVEVIPTSQSTPVPSDPHQTDTPQVLQITETQKIKNISLTHEDLEPHHLLHLQIQPEIVGGNRAAPVHVLDCPHGELLTFWRPPTIADLEYETPYKKYGPAEKYVTFEPG